MDAETETMDGEGGCVHTIHTELRRFFAGHLSGGSQNTVLVVAVSGGTDSLCLADALITLKDELGVEPIIAHLNHGLRGQAAIDDAEFVRSFAEQHQARCIICAADVRSLATDQHLSIEAAARTARYRFLEDTCIAAGASFVAVAHNSDDQVETVLLRLIRGSGISGLQGMRSASPLQTAKASGRAPIMLLRPLLGISRATTACYCVARQLKPRHDETNDELHHTRNRIRHELLPLLRQYNAGISTVLRRLAETAATDMEVVEYATHKTISALLVKGSREELILDRTVWRELPVGLQRTVLRECVRRIAGDVTNLKYAGIEEARDVLNSAAASGQIAILATVRIHVNPSRFWFEKV